MENVQNLKTEGNGACKYPLNQANNVIIVLTVLAFWNIWHFLPSGNTKATSAWVTTTEKARVLVDEKFQITVPLL